MDVGALARDGRLGLGVNARIGPLLLLLLLALAPGAASGRYFSIVTEHFLSPGETGGGLVTCGLAFEVLGGGFDPATADGMTGTASGPDYNTLAPPVSIRWVAQMENHGQAEQSFKRASICGNLPVTSVTTESFSVPAHPANSQEDTLATDSILCPLGSVALGGGVLNSGPLRARMVASAPTFGFNPLTSSLASQPDGENPAPNGWEVEYASAVNAPFDYQFGVVCADFDDVVTIVESGVADPGEVAFRTATCPDGKTAVAGGVDADDRTKLRIASNAPLYFGFPFPKRLFQQSNTASLDAPGPAPTGWRVAVRNEGTAAKSFKVAAICAPEPTGPALATAAFAALARLRRRA